MTMQSPHIVLLTLKIISNNDIVLARQRARQVAALLHFDTAMQTKVATVVSEIARNAYQYAGGGKVEFCISKDFNKPTFIVRISDKGPGIIDLSEILSGQYISKTGSRGVGIIGSKRVMDRFRVYSAPGQGTEVIAEIDFSRTGLNINSQFLVKIVDELSKHRPSSPIEEVQYQNQELLQTLDSLSKARDELEIRVEQRTKQLATTNKQLKQEMEERKRAEEWIQQHQHDLSRVERINSMGEMASALAHEINQPLGAITSYIQGCIRRLQTDGFQKEQLLEAMEKAAQQSIRAGEIIHRMKDFSRKGRLALELSDANQLIKETMIIMQHELEKQAITLTFDLDQAIPMQLFDTIQIQQVIINIVRNAIQAMNEAQRSTPTITITTKVIHEHCIDISIADNGPGITIADPQQLFEPYFTTKKNGMGMGLSISRTVVEAHNGKLFAKNNPDGGAIFHIQLPIEVNQDE